MLEFQNAESGEVPGSGTFHRYGHLVILILMMLCAFGLRTRGNDFGLPFGDYADEIGIPLRAAYMIRTGDYNPHSFYYPALTDYSIAFLTALSIRCDELFVKLSQKAPNTKKTDPIALTERAHIIGRTLSAFYGAFMLVPVFGIARTLFSPAVGLAACFLVSLQPALVLHGHLATVDMSLLFWMMAASWAGLRFAVTGRMRNLYIGAVCIGIATSAKYNGCFLLVPFILALVGQIRRNKHTFIKHVLVHGLVMIFLSLTVFFLIAPYSLIDYALCKEHILWEFYHQRVGHQALGCSGNHETLPLYWGFLHHGFNLYHALDIHLLLLALAGVVLLLFESYSLPRLYFLSVPLSYILLMFWSKNAPERYTMLLYPFCIICAVYVLDRVVRSLAFGRSALIFLVIFCALPFIRESAMLLSILGTPQTCAQAREWFFANIPNEIGRAVDPYTGVWVDAHRNNHFKLPSLAHDSKLSRQYSVDWYSRNQVELLVCSSIIRKRDSTVIERFPVIGQFYHWLNYQAYKVKTFTGQSYQLFNPTIDIYIRPQERIMNNDNTSVTIRLSFNKEPPNTYIFLWNGIALYRGKEKAGEFSLTFNEKSNLGIVFFPTTEPAQFEPINLSLEFIGEEAGPNGYEFSHMTGQAGVNIPFIFSATPTK
ncbi:glycosyltransferase family 39 protein [bacterium]|nr:glycosyltransferase family 39 protein [bacterium]